MEAVGFPVLLRRNCLYTLTNFKLLNQLIIYNYLFALLFFTLNLISEMHLTGLSASCDCGIS